MRKVALIPAYEPDDKLIQLAKELKNREFYCIIIDDGSGTKYSNIFKECKKNAHIISYNENKGKGYALKTGLEYIKREFSNYVVITIDSDGQHRVEDAGKLAVFAMNNKDTLVLGMRKRDRKVPFRSKLGNGITRFIYKISTGLDIYDTQTGLRAFSEELIDEMLKIEGEKYEYEMNVLLKFARNKIKIKEIEIQTIYIENNKGSHFNVVKDSLKIYKEIIKFSLSSITSFIIDYGLYGLFTIIFNNVILANISARIISSNYNFFINKLVVFKSDKGTLKSYIQYFLLVIIMLTLNTLVLNALVDFCNINKYVAKIITELTLFIINLVVQKKLIFKKEES